MTERDPSDLGVGDRRRYYQMGIEDGLQQGKEALTDEELLQEVVMRGLDYHRPLDEERLRKTAHDSFNAGLASGMERAEVASTPRQHPPFDIIAPPGKTWWEFWK